MIDGLCRAYHISPPVLLEMSPFDLALTIRSWLAGREHRGSLVERARQAGGLAGLAGSLLAALMSRP
tara:strand:+ start:135 stop:335 length:201 start_codon:yes stop_codon:yes gene_type:complete